MNITNRYRADYTGEFVVTNLVWAGNQKHQTREWLPNPIENQHISGRAAVIGSALDQEQFDFKKLEKHKGGLLGQKKLQTYGSGDLWKSMKFDFYVTSSDSHLQEVNATGYSEQNIVYTTAKNVSKYPGKFYLVPHIGRLDELAMAVYLAAFDGHNEVFLFGYNNDTHDIAGRITWKEHVNSIFAAYKTTEFILVGTETNMPDMWKNNRNVSCQNFRQFITYCDV